MLEMFNDTDKLTVGELKEILNSIPNDMIVCTENVQDGINRHNEICGFENDEDDEFFVLKIDNERHEEAKFFANWIAEHLYSHKKLTENDKSVLEQAQEYNE